ncbi:MAG: type I-E CRISPR-associated protein Cse1/CasA [Deltaproteobacteria bacterium]|nr:type I-E CRISPR-associated protein Cse1/CasA [Deltaproteobacteria bacterium]MBW2333707.1 type I-E CRISPR-associated protein Cse1/CasA [Deltaproteobacteria bacterium]
MNLITDAWIPVRRKSGKVERIAPWQITEDEDVITVLAAPRPDFNGALIQFLIGLLQTTCAPKNPHEWRKWFQKPPGSKELQEAFEPIAYAFELDGDGPRFMQETDLKNSKKAKIQPITYLLIDAPTDNTIKDNIDLFVKRTSQTKTDDGVIFCLPCVAAALFTIQTFAPSGGGGGGGKFTSLRGGGPLSTIVVENTLWKTLWLNVMEMSYFYSNKNYPIEHTFPWLQPGKFIRSKKGRAITSEEMDPLHVYWGMPRRVFFDIKYGEIEKQCFVCGCMTNKYSGNYKDLTMGISYFVGSGKNKKPSWVYPLHPLSPYFIDKDGTPAAIHPQSGGIGYRHWLGLVQSDKGNKGKRKPASVIEHFILERRRDLRMWAFGYDMDNMKARCWYDSTMPLFFINDNFQEEYENRISCMVKASKWVCGALLLGCLRASYFEPTVNKSNNVLWKVPKTWKKFGKKTEEDIEGLTIKEKKALLEQIRSSFWQSTEGDFFECLSKLRDALNRGDDVVPILEGWHKCLSSRGETIFNDVSQIGAFDAANPKRIALAWRDLKKSIYGKKLRELLGIPAT